MYIVNVSEVISAHFFYSLSECEYLFIDLHNSLE